MNYYMIRSGRTCAVGSDIINIEGNPIEEGEFVNDNAHLCHMDSLDVRPLGDLMSTGFNPIVVSVKAAQVISKFQLQKNTQIFPVTLVEIDFEAEEKLEEIQPNQIIGEACGILFNWLDEDIMDDKDKKAYNKQDPIDRGRGNARPPVVLGEIVNRYDVLNGVGLGVLVSERVKEAIEDAELTNFRFLPVQLK